MSRRRCKCKCKCKCKCRCKDRCDDRGRRSCGFNACTVIPTLLILCQSGLLCNDRAYILILLSLMCGGFDAQGFGNCGFGC